MTNKTERYFVVSESELDKLIEEAIENYINPDQRERGRLREAEAACRAHPVTEEQALFLGLPSKYDLEMKILKDAGD